MEQADENPTPDNNIEVDEINPELIDKFWEELSVDIERGHVPLPSLPEITLKVRKLLDNPGVTTHQVSRVITADAVLSTRLLTIANSPVYRGNSHIDDVKAAITRLGNATVRQIVTSLAMQTLYQNSLPKNIKQHLVESWEHSVAVASIAFFLARKYTRLNPDEALLAGLIHDIGLLPILEYADLYPNIIENEALLQQVIYQLHPQVGKMILEAWDFSEELVTAASEHENMTFQSGSNTPDYIDLVIVANLLTEIANRHGSHHYPKPKVDWLEVSSFKKLNLSPEQAIETIREARKDLLEIQKLFTG